MAKVVTLYFMHLLCFAPIFIMCVRPGVGEPLQEMMSLASQMPQTFTACCGVNGEAVCTHTYQADTALKDVCSRCRRTRDVLTPDQIMRDMETSACSSKPACGDLSDTAWNKEVTDSFAIKVLCNLKREAIEASGIRQNFSTVFVQHALAAYLECWKSTKVNAKYKKRCRKRFKALDKKNRYRTVTITKCPEEESAEDLYLIALKSQGAGFQLSQGQREANQAAGCPGWS